MWFRYHFPTLRMYLYSTLNLSWILIADLESAKLGQLPQGLEFRKISTSVAFIEYTFTSNERILFFSYHFKMQNIRIIGCDWGTCRDRVVARLKCWGGQINGYRQQNGSLSSGVLEEKISWVGERLYLRDLPPHPLATPRLCFSAFNSNIYLHLLGATFKLL